MTTYKYEVQYTRKGGGIRTMTVEAISPHDAKDIVESMLPGAKALIGTKIEEETASSVNSDPTISAPSPGGLLLVGGGLALYFALLYAPFVCAGGSAIAAGKYIKTRWHWKTFWVLLFALVGFLGGDVIKQKVELGEYENNPAKMNIIEEVVDTIFTQPIRNSVSRS